MNDKFSIKNKLILNLFHFHFLQIYAVGGRNWFEGEGGIEEEIFSSTEVFDTETEKWSAGPDLPKPLAFATAVTAPHATFILGGQTEAGNMYSVSLSSDS